MSNINTIIRKERAEGRKTFTAQNGGALAGAVGATLKARPLAETPPRGVRGHEACASPFGHHALSQARRRSFMLALCEACPQPSLVLPALFISQPESCATGKQNLGSIGVLCWSRAQVLGRVGASQHRVWNVKWQALQIKRQNYFHLAAEREEVPCLPSRVPGYSESLGLQLSSAETQAAIKHLPSAGYSSAVCIHPGKAKNKNLNG